MKVLAEVVRTLGLVVVVAVVIGLISQALTGQRSSLWALMAWGLAGNVWGRLYFPARPRKASKNKAVRSGSTEPRSPSGDAKPPPSE
jgi:hypothetical protein